MENNENKLNFRKISFIANTDYIKKFDYYGKKKGISRTSLLNFLISQYVEEQENMEEKNK